MKTFALICALAAILSFIAGQWTLAFGLGAASGYFWDGDDDDDAPEAVPVDD